MQKNKKWEKVLFVDLSPQVKLPHILESLHVEEKFQAVSVWISMITALEFHIGRSKL